MYTLNISIVPNGAEPMDLIGYVRDALAPAVADALPKPCRFGRVIDVDGVKLADPRESTFSLQLRFDSYAEAVRHESTFVRPALDAMRAHFGASALCVSMIIKTIPL